MSSISCCDAPIVSPPIVGYNIIAVLGLGKTRVKFYIQPSSNIPPATQLYDQIVFAISAGHYGTGEQLPSSRQLAAWTGLHRNTVNKVFYQLKQTGLVESRGGSGIYVRPQSPSGSDLSSQIHTMIDHMVRTGHPLPQVRDQVLRELDWRIQCSARVIVTSGREDIGVGQVMSMELTEALHTNVPMVPLEDLPAAIATMQAALVVTNGFWIERVRQALAGSKVRMLPLEIYNYAPEMARIMELPAGSRVGVVSISAGVLRMAESMIHSRRGEEILVLTALPQDTYRLQSLVSMAHLVLVGTTGFEAVHQAIAATKQQRLRPVELWRCPFYIAPEAIEMLRRELGLPQT
jgi:GntR family transcriptional regulator